MVSAKLYDGRLAVDIAGLKMQTPVTTASGTFGFGLEFTDFLDLEKVGAVCVKGTTLLPREGNKGQRVVETPSGMLNCVGLENPGSDYFLNETLPKLRKYDVPVIVNIAASSPEEYGELAHKLDVDGVDAVEINISCPNVKQGGIAFGTCPDSAAAVVEQVKKHFTKTVITKLSPNVTSITEMALVGKINTDLVGRLNRLGGKAVGLNGKDDNLIQARKHLADVYENGEVNLVDIGYVGTVEHINTELLNVLLDNDFIPVIAPTGVGATGETYNINADSVAGEIAGALKAEKLLVLTDVKGIYADYRDESTFLSTMTFEKAQELIIKGNIDGGMIPKVKACITALSGGAKKAQIIDGRAEHSILMEVFSDEGVGTEVVKTL